MSLLLLFGGTTEPTHSYDPQNKTEWGTLTNGNLSMAGIDGLGGDVGAAISNTYKTSGKWAVQFTFGAATTNAQAGFLGEKTFFNPDHRIYGTIGGTWNNLDGVPPGGSGVGAGISIASSGRYINVMGVVEDLGFDCVSNEFLGYGASQPAVVLLLIDIDNLKFYVQYDGVFYGGQDPSSNKGYDLNSGVLEWRAAGGSGDDGVNANIQFSGHTYSVSGFSEWEPSSGNVAITGAPAIGTFTGTGNTTKVDVKVSGSPAPNAFTGSGVVKVRVKTSGAPAPNAFTGSGVVKVRVKALGAPSIATFTSQGTIRPRVKVSGAPQIGTFTSQSAAFVRVKVSGAPEIGTFLGQAAAKLPIEGTGNGIIGVFTSVGFISALQDIVGAPEIQPFTGSGTVRTRVKTSGAPSINAFTSSGTVRPHAKVSGAPQTAAFTGSGTPKVRVKVSGAPQTAAFTGSGLIRPHGKVSGAPAIGDFTSSGGVRVRVKTVGVLPMLPFTGQGFIGYVPTVETPPGRTVELNGNLEGRIVDLELDGPNVLTFTSSGLAGRTVNLTAEVN